MVKKCTKCGVEKPRTKEYFALDKRRKDGLGSHCKRCNNSRATIWKKKNPEKVLEQNKKYRQKNKEKQSKDHKKYYKTLRGYICHLVAGIKQRCTNPKRHNYKSYGGKRIKCKFTSQELYDWLITNSIDPRGLEIHRIDSGDNYTLDNIIFITKEEHIELHRKE